MDPLPKSLERLGEQIDGWLDLRCPDKALALLGPLLDEPTARGAGLVFRVRALARMGRYADALPDLDELRQRAPTDDWVDLTEAWCRKRLGDLQGAVRVLDGLLARDHRHGIARYNLACYLALLGERERAIDELSLACGLDSICRDCLRDEPDFDGLRTDERFRQLLRAVVTPGDGEAFDGSDDEADDDDGPPAPDDAAERRN